MAYLGAQPNKTLTKTTSQSFNGTGSATTFTLNRAVNTEEELEVFVENVQQEPGSGKSYTATGTTLTFDEAPPSGTGNIYVIYRGQAEVTTRLEHDANQALSATTGTFNHRRQRRRNIRKGRSDVYGIWRLTWRHLTLRTFRPSQRKTTAAGAWATLTTDILTNAAASGKVLKVCTIMVSNVDGSNSADVTVDYYDGSTGFKIALYDSGPC